MAFTPSYEHLIESANEHAEEEVEHEKAHKEAAEDQRATLKETALAANTAVKDQEVATVEAQTLLDELKRKTFVSAREFIARLVEYLPTFATIY